MCDSIVVDEKLIYLDIPSTEAALVSSGIKL